MTCLTMEERACQASAISSFFFFFPFLLFYERLMYSHASARAVRYYLHSLTPLRQTHVMTHAMEQEEEEEEKKRCC